MHRRRSSRRQTAGRDARLQRQHNAAATKVQKVQRGRAARRAHAARYNVNVIPREINRDASQLSDRLGV